MRAAPITVGRLHRGETELPIRAAINYAARTEFRQRYYANDHSRDTVVVAAQVMPLSSGRGIESTLDQAGFVLTNHVSQVADFTVASNVTAVHPTEIIALVRENSGADSVIVTGPGILRFSESSANAGRLDNSMPARFAHVDMSARTAEEFARNALPEGRTLRRYAHFNVWRSFSGPPQDVPLALCDARSVATQDLLVADAIFDEPDRPEWSFESWLLAHNPAHRWHWFPDMTRDEVLIFKTSDSAHANPVPHVAFDNPLAPVGCDPVDHSGE